jgi:hypothetical protein
LGADTNPAHDAVGPGKDLVVFPALAVGNLAVELLVFPVTGGRFGRLISHAGKVAPPEPRRKREMHLPPGEVRDSWACHAGRSGCHQTQDADSPIAPSVVSRMERQKL